MASGWPAPRRRPGTSLGPWNPSSPPPLLEEAVKPSRRSTFSRGRVSQRTTRQTVQPHVELEVEAIAEQHEREKRRSFLAFMLGPESALRTLRSVSDATSPAPTLVQREKAFRLVRHGSDPMLNDAFYATQVQVGNFVKMGWLTKQGHLWKSWKTRFFVLFSDGTFAYYKNRGRKKIKGCMQLNDGVVSVQHVDIRVAEKAYVFQIEKGFYKLLCYCSSQFEAEIWVSALRSVRRVAPPCFEMDLTATEEKAGSNAVTRHMNKIFVTDEHIANRLIEFKERENDHSYVAIHNFIVELDDAIIDRHHLELYRDPEIILLPGNELVRLIRRHVEDRVFVPLYADAYASLESCKVKSRRRNVERNRKVLKQKTQADFGIAKDLSVCKWDQAIGAINLLDCVSLPTHKFEVILSAGKVITELIAKYNDEHFEVSDETLTAVFRYVVTMSSLSDLPILRVLLKHGYKQHPACQNKANIVRAFLDAAKWVECFEPSDESYRFDSLGLAGSRVSVSISTNDIGIQFTTDGNGRGAVVYSVRKLSQAALSSSIVAGLSLIAINHEPVIGMPFDKIVQQVRTAALPKQLTFMTEFYYYQLLSLDADMFRYLMCIAGRRGDLDSAIWLQSPAMELNSLCSWEKSRGKQVFGFVPVSGKGSPLHAAVHNGQLHMVNYLISKGADVNLCDHKGRRPLHVVKKSAEMALIIESLVNMGAEIDAMDKHGLTPLMSMCARASLEGSATLLDLGANVHCVAWSNGFSALEFAVNSECTDLVALCLSKGSNPNAPTLDGNTSLHLAAALSHADIIIELLQSGANLDARNRYGQTPATVLLASDLGGHGVAPVTCLGTVAHDGCHRNTHDVPSFRGRLPKACSEHCLDDDADFNSSDSALSDRVPGGHYHTNQATGCMRSQLPDDVWKITGKNNLVSRSMRSKSVDNMVCDLVLGADVDLVDYVAFVLFLDSFSSLNKLVELLSDYVRDGVKSHGFIRLIILMMLFRLSNTEEADDDVWDRLSSLFGHNVDVSKKKLVALVGDYLSLYREYFHLRGAGNYAVSYESIPEMMTKLYGQDAGVGPVDCKSFPGYLHRYIDAEQWAVECTLLTHAVFCKIPVQDFICTGSKIEQCVEFAVIKRWFQHLSAYVINAVLVQDTPAERAAVISFYLKLSVQAKKMMNEMQLLSDKGCREMNQLMRNTANPCMPYIGLYLQGFVGLNELPTFGSDGLVNGNRLRRTGELAMEILHRQSVAYALPTSEKIGKLLHVTMPYASEESRYARSLELEPREADAIPLSDSGSCAVIDDDLDLANEVRGSIGSDGTFGFRQWIRKQQVVHRYRSRSSLIALYEWV
ncbi:unnamed protein product [Hyaloperonospora brassicae]|uniref:PH domain-containing protein n=1 Tax=Hyaloperonospora brassicae TaxID=162125 RepID=A0AAV0T049_HYABA|nr:unnamed protein product [Hyaloperonospora brassicae]